jgi:L-fuculose-phosphate aldolase
MRKEVDALKEKVAFACKILVVQGLADFLGHVSCKIPGTESVLISPRATDLAGIRKEDILTVNLKGDVVEGDGKPPSELPIHLSIYRLRQDVGSVIHTHPKFATLFSIVEEPIVPVHHLGVPFIDGVPLFDDYGLIDDTAMAERLAMALGNKKAVLLKNHGIVVVGRTVEEACILSVWLEKNCELQLLSKILGKVDAIPLEDKSKNLVNHYLERTVRAAWNYYVSLIKGF